MATVDDRSRCVVTHAENPLTIRDDTALTVLSLPFEILTGIIQLGLPASTKWDRFWKARRAICLVNHRFHDVVYATPRFWTYVYITLHTKPEFVATSIDNARSLSVFLEIDISAVAAQDRIPDFMENKMPLFRSNFQRVHHLKLRCQPAEWITLLTEVATGCSIHFEQLEFTIATPLGTDIYAYRSDASPPMVHMPALRDLSLTCWPRLWRDPALYSGLTCLRLRGIAFYFKVSWDSFAAVLEAATGLQILEIINVCCLGLDQGRRITLPSVSRFVFHFWQRASLGAISLVSFPALKELDIGIGSDAHIDAVVESGILAAAESVRVEVLSTWGDRMHRLLSAAQHVIKLDLNAADDCLLTCLLQFLDHRSLDFRNLVEFKVPFVLETDDAKRMLDHAQIVVARPDYTQQYSCKVWSDVGGKLAWRLCHYEDRFGSEDLVFVDNN